MELFIHYGFTKAGSTSFQNSLLEYKEFLISHGFYYKSFDANMSFNNFPNDFELYEYINNGNEAAAFNYIDTLILDAKNLNCDKIIISSENFIYFFEGDSSKYYNLLNVVNKFNFSAVNELIIIRNFNKLIYSNLLQLLSNGVLNTVPSVSEYCSYIGGIFESIMIKSSCLLIHIDLIPSSSNLINEIFNKFLKLQGDYDNLITNHSDYKNFFTEALIGTIVKLIVSERGLNINSSFADDQRDILYSLIYDNVKTDVMNLISKEFEKIIYDTIHEGNFDWPLM